jgi:hypothetical protein
MKEYSRNKVKKIHLQTANSNTEEGKKECRMMTVHTLTAEGKEMEGNEG